MHYSKIENYRHQTVTEHGVSDTNGQFSVAQKFLKQIDETNWSEGYSWYDGLGRTVKSQSVDSNGDVFTETTYDNMSRPKKATNPYRTGETKLWTESFYDDLGRATKIKTPDNAEVLTSYDLATTGANIGTVVTVKDQALKERRSITNGLGQLTRVDEPTDSGLGTIASPNQPTNYGYDTLNNLVQVQQIGTNTAQCGGTSSSCTQTRSFVYDSISRLKSATNLESGTVNYNYDANSNLATKTDARGITTTYSYDALNRIKLRDYSDSTNDVIYKYDNLTNAKGQLIEVDNTISKTKYLSFDIMGRVTSSQQITDGTTYNPMTYVYNLSGALLEETYPSGRVVKNTLDTDGSLQQVQSKKLNDTFRNYANSFNYTTAGAVSSMRLGNGRWENMQFNSRLQPTQIGLGMSAANQGLLKLDYEYGELQTNGSVDTLKNNGNIAKQTLTVPSVGSNQGFTAVQTYTYDSLNRLKDAKEMIGTTQTWKQTFVYDRYGNRRFDQANTTYPTSFSNPNITNPNIDPSNNRFTTGQGYTYDLSGNLITDAEGRSFFYDAENKQKEAKNASNQTLGEYFYDGDGKRVKKYVPSTGEITIFVYSSSGKMVAEYSTIVESQATAKISYLTNDHLGSPRIITDQNGAVVSRRDFMPFGEEISSTQRTTGLSYSSDNVRQKFTSYERDVEINLDFGKARYYDKKLGRFYSVDPENFGADERDAQSWNGYAYVRNNPINLVDPEGLDYRVCYANGKCYNYNDQEFANYKNELPSELKAVGSERNGIILDPDNNNVIATYSYFESNAPTLRDIIIGLGGVTATGGAAATGAGGAIGGAIGGVVGGIATVKADGENSGGGSGNNNKRRPPWTSYPAFGHTFSKHGMGPKRTIGLTHRAAGTKTPQGQWLSNDAAANFLLDVTADLAPGVHEISIPPGMGRVILPDGSYQNTSRALVIIRPNGAIKDAYPIPEE